ncbi:MAG: ABC transporter ATP-binding protein/permease [Firmicutes bacterium]|nr:ABC transporter ATP-binding protein/permease [Bacillota bacterium]
MLEIKNIKKIYKLEDFEQNALNDVSINFRKNEFVSILGPSGSGKTTLLNIIGGLDKYTSGDLIINGVSTKNYNDHDWDIYRNHKIGFVFQSYNLIPHQTILSNVELALTLSGVSKKERKVRAVKALESVGLKEHINKKPNQLSGGQMQRVAIARALINNPEIVLADEPSGALDTKTSIQIMDLLKEIAKDRLVIMVTHNPELAEKYSTRIINLKDGVIEGDSNPYNEDIKSVKSKIKKKHKSSMSFKTAISLSLNNLMTKKGRTILTAFAGSIGIIGISLIMALSNGIELYIAKVQEDTMTSYPLTIEKQTVDITSFMSNMTSQNAEKHEDDKVYSNNIMTDMMSMMTAQVSTNNLVDFKEYIEDNKELQGLVNDIKYSYNFDLNIYLGDTSQGLLKVNPSNILTEMGMGSEMMSTYNLWTELTNNQELLDSQYDILAGRLPSAYNEIVLIVDENNSVSDYALYSLGLKDKKELYSLFQSTMKGEEYVTEDKNYTYDEILDLKYKLVLNSNLYKKENEVWVNKELDISYMKKLVEESEDIKVVGIIRPNEEAAISSTTGGIGYISELTQYVIEKNNNSKIAKEQIANKEINVLTGAEFKAAESYENNLSSFGVIDLDSPDVINIYPKSFEAKEEIENLISEYNEAKEEEDKIQYTDYVGLLMNSVTTIVNMISYVLIAFVSISLVVSSIMIGIITYISVLERTKEIGILRSIGASKKDISRVFNAETFIIGLISGLLGISITLLISIPTNILLKQLVNISGLCQLPVGGSIILVIISIILTVIAGVIPAKIASKKDPVIALRTE